MKLRLKSIGENGSLVFQQNQKITQLGKSGRIEEAIKIFNQMPVRNTVTYNSMISVYAKNGRIRDAHELFDGMPNRNLVSWNTMISGCLHNDKVEKACELFHKMPQRDYFSWTLMITCYTRHGDLEKARKLFDLLPDKRNPACWNAMISGYAKSRHLRDARELFDEMSVKNLISWNSMLAGYTQNGEMLLGLKFFEEMVDKDVVSWNLVVDGFVEIGDLASAWQFFQRIPNPNVVSWVTMLCGFARNGQILEARRLFNQMPDKNVVSWNSMISCYIQEGCFTEALDLFREMCDSRIVPDETTLVSVLSACCQLGDLAMGKKIHDYICNKRVTFSVTLYNALVDMYAKCGYVETALAIFLDMPDKNLVSWNVMIGALALHGHGSKAIELFETMEDGGTYPDEITFTGLLSACCHCGLVDRGRYYFDRMTCIYRVGCDIEHYACMIDLLGRGGLFGEAMKLIGGMPMKPDIVIWGALLGGCRIHGNIEIAKQILKQVLELETYSAGLYVLFSNIYCEAQRWEDMKSIRKLLNEHGIKKGSGISSVEFDGCVDEFMGDDDQRHNLIS